MKRRLLRYWRLGSFVLVGIVALAGIGVWLMAAGLGTSSVSYVTYFSGNVGGLQSGSKIDFRGVQVGQVGTVEIAPKGRRIVVHAGLWKSKLKRLEIDPDGEIPPAMRFRLASSGLTGGMQMEVAFVDPSKTPAPELGFQPPDHYVPADESGYASITDAVQGVAADLGGAGKDLRSLIGELRSTVRNADLASVSLRAQSLLTDAEPAVQAVQSVAARFDGLSGQIAVALRTIQTSLQEVERLAAALNRDPGALLRGRVSSEEK